MSSSSGKSWGRVGVVVFALAALLAVRLIGPAVPDEIRLMTGPEGTPFFDDGLRYKEVLGRHGVVVHLQETSGSIENLRTVIDAEGPTAAFIRGLWEGSGRTVEGPEGVESLGTMSLTPLWVFSRKGADRADLADLARLRALRVEAGREGSDPRVLALMVLTEEGVGDRVDFGEDHPATGDELREALGDGRVAAFVAIGEPSSRLIDRLLRSPELQVVSARRAEAFALQFPFLKPVRFPEGAHDLRANIPDRDLDLLAVRVQLVVSDHFPPALADLLLQAAAEIHGKATPFSSQGEFPNRQSAPLRLKRAADSFYRNGPSALQKYLPFRLATWVNRFLLAGAALASAAVTIFNIAPALIGLPFRRSLERGFSELRAIERSAAAGADRKALRERLASVDRSTADIRVPLRRLEAQWLELRQCLHDMRERLGD